ncbi:unnamed protein product [Thlaspi arvense]|uniref:TFIIS N-terminal domain-containing protein n=1 Tax=Thlaspi arvense TaxID=13288 RepID=A0AAU9T793_THLAR|nr:unnamed protein product [Thlaspi arvense]
MCLQENLDDFVEPKANNCNDKAGKKRQRKEKHEPGLEKEIKKKKQDSVRDDLKKKSTEIKEMWDSITNNNNSGDLVANRPKKDDDDDDDELIIRLFRRRNKKSKLGKKPEEIAMQVERVMAILEIAVEDDLALNKEGKPAINKLMKLPLLNGALSKKQLQSEFLDHGLLNLLKNWLEPLPDGSLPSINIRRAILTILNDLCNLIDQQECRKEQLVKSGLGKVIMFLSKSDEETTFNKRLANDLVNRWGHIIYNKSTRYEEMFTQEEREEQHQVLLARQTRKLLRCPRQQKLEILR